MKLKISLNNAKESVIHLMPESERDIFFIGQLTQKLENSIASFSSNTDQLKPVLELLEFTPEVLFSYLANSFKLKS